MSRRSVWLLFLVVWAVYLGVGLYLAFGMQFFIGDSLSRVQAAQSVLFSRDPHLSAIGFIFTPLTAMVQLPLTALTPLWPPMTTDAVSAAIMSSAFMSGAVVQVSGVARDRGLPSWMAIAVTVCFAANPMIVFYAANGMSEAPYLFFLCWAARRLMRWVDTDDVHDLIIAGLAFALGYLTRYDGGAASLAGALLVAVVTFRRTPSEKRWSRTLIDTAIVVSPSAMAFFTWAYISWLITGELFAQTSSQYGNSSIIEQSGGTGSDTAAVALGFSLTELAILAPLLPLVLALVLVIRFRRRRLYPVMAVLAIFVAVLAFQVLSYMRGTTFGFLRFYITVIPLSAIVALLIIPARRTVPYRRLGGHAQIPAVREHPRHRRAYLVMGLVGVLGVLIGIPSTTYGMASPKYAPQEFALVTLTAPRPDTTSQRYLDAQRVARTFSTERALAQYLDRLNLPDGSVICDTVYGFAVVVRSTHPKQFVIPSDEDFTEILNDPKGNRVQYILAVPKEGRGESDAVNIRYPTMYTDGAQIASLVLEAPNDGANQPTWRLYQVTG